MNNVVITLENFQQVILEDSKSTLVLVDFWAQQVPESVELRDKLAVRLAEFSEHVIFATVDCATEQQIAQQFGIQSLPTAVIVKEGQPIDGLTGPQTDETIQALLDKYLPKPQDLLLQQAKQLLVEHKINDAFSIITQAYQLDSENAEIKLVLADVYIQTGKLAEAEALLTTIKMIDQNSDYEAIMAKFELAQQASESPEIKALEAELEKSPSNTALIHQLAAQYSQVNRHEDALVLLFRTVQSDSSDSDSKTLLLDILKALPEGDPLATKYRRKLYTLMY